MNGMPSEHVSLCVCDTLGNVLNTLQVNEFDAQKVAEGDVLTLSLRYRMSQFKTKETQQDAYVNHIEVNGFMVIARKEIQGF